MAEAPHRAADARPDPDALLALAEKDRRGRLTLFLGAAPGVGKTYAMLSRARRLKADGVDIVIGLVETHGRSETAALLDGLEVLPRRRVAHSSGTLDEFDLDAALARHPRIMVVDEMAHTNAPDSRHPKRHHDIEELLAAGIDVWSAMNVQHVESLADVVAQITGVPVRERVPDTVLARADQVLLVDLPPAELIERLKAGKVYLPDNAARATEGFFRIGNLTALRELALRRTAARVDDEMVDYLRQNAIEGPWQSGERLLVCIGPDALSEKVVRTAARLAAGLNAPWLVASIEHPERVGADPRLDDTFKLAESLGAETRRVPGRDFVDAILKLARRENATQIVVGGRRLGFPARLWRTSLTDALVREADGVGVHVVSSEERHLQAQARNPKAPLRLRQLPVQIGVSVMSVAVATWLGSSVERFIDLPNVSLLYVLAVLASAFYGGYPGALTAAMLSALAYNFFFIDPEYSFTIARPHEVFGLFVFIVAALAAGGIASRIGAQARAAGKRASETQALYDFSRKLSGTAEADDVVWTAVTHLRGAMQRGVVFLLPQDGQLALAAAWPPETELGVGDMTAARWAFERREPAGKGTGTLPSSDFQFRPLTSPTGVIGVIGLHAGAGTPDGEAEKTLGAILDQTAIAIDRARLSKESLDQAARLEGEKFRSALLSSISHDLKTPLATITGAVSSLRELGDRMAPATRDDLLASIDEEGQRLARFVANLLDMTRIDAGTVQARRDWLDVGDVIGGALARARKSFPEHAVETSIAADLPLIRGDATLLEQVLFNLFDNAIKHGGGEAVSIYARRDGDRLEVSVSDLGRGIPAKDLGRVFEKFYRRGKTDGRAPGTGLGLAIAKGFVEAMGGEIVVESPARQRRGTRFTLYLPVPAEANSASMRG